jgi:hypothetical protein
MDSINLPFLLVNNLLVVDLLLPLVLLSLPFPILLLFFHSPNRLAIQLTWDINTGFCYSNKCRTTCPLNKEFMHTQTKKNSDKYGIQTSYCSARTYCYQLVRSYGMTT